jgi:glycosyltransferase involved in cell wall biosynthesis
MKFSVLLPTRNRLELLRYAIESVRRQAYSNWEIVVSDNDSGEDVVGYVTGLADPRIRYVRTPRFVPVTDNWNNALAHSSGDYVVMLGDDDCLLQGYFSKLAELVTRYAGPDCIYVDAVQFAYPGVIPGHPKGFVQTGYSDILRGCTEPGLLARADALAAVRKSMSLRLSFSYNMQHALVSRRFIDSLASLGPFYQSPYPDYYASNVILLVAKSVVVDPRAMVAIGISPKSFGYYYFNDRADEGTAFLNNLDAESIPEPVRRNLLPGNPLFTSWYLAMAAIERNFGREYGVATHADRYRFVQVYAADRAKGIQTLRSYWAHLNWDERLLFSIILVMLHALPRLLPGGAGMRLVERYARRVSPFPIFDPKIREVEYRTILELFEELPA